MNMCIPRAKTNPIAINNRDRQLELLLMIIGAYKIGTRIFYSLFNIASGSKINHDAYCPLIAVKRNKLKNNSSTKS